MQLSPSRSAVFSPGKSQLIFHVIAHYGRRVQSCFLSVLLLRCCVRKIDKHRLMSSQTRGGTLLTGPRRRERRKKKCWKLDFNFFFVAVSLRFLHQKVRLPGKSQGKFVNLINLNDGLHSSSEYEHFGKQYQYFILQMDVIFQIHRTHFYVLIFLLN